MPKHSNRKNDDSSPDRPIRTTEDWPVGMLKRNPRQDVNFHPLSEDELSAIADDMRRNGQHVPIEILPDGRIVDGHQRSRAAEQLGWSTVMVVVRHDLAGDEAAIERRLIEANSHRRQLDVLDRIRAARRILELENRAKPGGLNPYQEQDLRDRIGKQLGMSGRNAQRYLNVLNTPMEVQQCVSRNKLTLLTAEKVGRLGAQDQAEIAAGIRAGGEPASVVAAHLPKPAPPEINPDREYERFLKAAIDANRDLEGLEDRVRGGPDLDAEIRDLEQTKGLIDRLIRRHQTAKKKRAQILSESGMPKP